MITTRNQLVRDLAATDKAKWISPAGDYRAYVFRKIAGSVEYCTIQGIKLDEGEDWIVLRDWAPTDNTDTDYLSPICTSPNLPVDPLYLRYFSPDGHGYPVDAYCTASLTTTRTEEIKHLFPDVDYIRRNWVAVSHGLYLAIALAEYNEQTDRWDLRSSFRSYENGEVVHIYGEE